MRFLRYTCFSAQKTYNIHYNIPLTHYRPVMPFGNRKNILEDRFSLALSQFKKYHPSGNLKFNNSGIYQSLKFRILTEKILTISHKLYFSPNTLGCHGLNTPVS